MKSSSKDFWVGMVKNGCGQSDYETQWLYHLKNEQME